MRYEALKDIELGEFHRQVRENTRRFAVEKIGPKVAEYEREERYPLEIIKEMGKLGMLGVIVPEEYGGAGMDYLSYGIICEELARVDWVCASIVSVQNSLVGSSLVRYGNEDQKRRYLMPLARGEMLASACLTEPCGGTDLASLESTARRTNGGYILNGSKVFISHAEYAGVFFVLASIDRSLRHKGICALLVEPAWKGVQIRRIPLYTLKRDNIAEVHFEDVPVPGKNLLGEEGGGFYIVAAALDTGRYSVACRCVGQAQACIDEALKYARERYQFGQPIGKFQMIQQKIADMVVMVEAARLLAYRVGRLKDRDPSGRYSIEASMAKLLASEVAVKCALEAIQIHGGYGFAEEYPVGRYLLEAKTLMVGEGTSELHRRLIAEYALGFKRY